MPFLLIPASRRGRSFALALGLAASAAGSYACDAALDRRPPAVSISSPANGATVSGQVTVTANATDDMRVAGVQFLLDGANLGTEITAPPYALTWDSTGTANGPHTLAARARDGAGNPATAAQVTVTVANEFSGRLELAPSIGNFDVPLDLQAPTDNSGRFFVVEQSGKIRIVQPDEQVLAAPFIDIATRPGFTWGGETGLLGLAFHPGFGTNGRFFVNYNRIAGGQLQTVIAEFTASPAGANVVDPATERILLLLEQPFANHNGGGLAFGRDGFLYIGLGDGGSGGDPFCNAQNLGTLLGKILRIDVTSAPPAGQAYVIPAGNPFVNQAGRRGEIWVYGLRNPFRFSFDRANGTDLYIGDVGQNAFEEVDFVTAQQAGANLGWNLREGAHPYSTSCAAAASPLVDPIFDYPHGQGDSSITGGFVYRGTAIPSLAGTYVFGDFISGRIWTLARNASGGWTRSAEAVLNMGAGNLSSFGEAPNGELYVVRYASGEIARIRQR